MSERKRTYGCECDGDCDRRGFLGVSTAALGGLAFTSLRAAGAETAAFENKPESPAAATIRVAFLYPPSKTFADNPDGWWSWPGNEFDAEGRQRQYTAALRDMEQRLGVQLAIDERPVADNTQAQALAAELEAQKPDGLLLVIHNICYETEGNGFYASHCTCATKLHGPDAPDAPYLLRRFAHSNEGSCAIQVFWNEGDPVTMVQYHPGKEPALDVYAGRVVKSHEMPPTAGCTTNVEVQITDLADNCQVGGGDWHNVLFCGDFARKFRLFAGLFKMKLLGGLTHV